MKRFFEHQLGVTFIVVHKDGHCTFRRKRYASYVTARRALTNYFGDAYEIKRDK